MDISTTATATATVRTPEAEAETPSRIQPIKASTFTNGVLKRNHSLNNHHHHHLNPPPAAVVITYKECLKNHAATMGGHAVDGCGEFMPSPTATPTDPTSLKCAACGCHRNFHRREPEEPLPSTTSAAQHVIEYQPHHRHHPPPPPPPPPLRGGNISPNSPSPPPISSSYYPSAPHMLLALSSGLSGHPPENNPAINTTATAIQPNSNGRKRFRTKFTQDQKSRMYEFAEKIEWKIQKRDEERISDFCSEVGVERTVLKVWMHNNKNTLGKKVENHIINGINTTTDHNHHNNDDDDDDGDQNLNHHQNSDSLSPRVVATNGSSSSS